MLQQFELQHEPDAFEAEIGAVDLDDRCPADVGADPFVGPRDGFPADDGLAGNACFWHGRCYYN